MKFYTSLILFLITYTSHSQITNTQINYELYVDQIYQGCDNDALSADDNEVRIGLSSDGNTGGTATWTTGGDGATCSGNLYVFRWQADAPSTITRSNRLLYRCVNRNNVANAFTINHASWEEDGAPDCDPSGDACQSSGTWTMTFKSGVKTPNRYWGYSGAANASNWVTGMTGDFTAKTIWRFANGNSCSNPLLFGTLTPGTTYTHINSNRLAPTGASADLGYTNMGNNNSPDVYYSFTLLMPSTVVISTMGAATNYDSYLRLYNSNCGTQITFNDDFGGTSSSQITQNLCAGTYSIQVEGFGGNAGDFELSVLATNLPISGGTIAGGTSPVCSGADPDAFTSTDNGGGVATLTYQWEVSTTSASLGFSNITSATAVTYDIPAVTQTSWFRRRITDACGRTAYSNVIQIEVHSASTSPTIAIVPGTVCPNTNTTLTASGGVVGGGTVHWYSGTNGTGTLLGTGNSVVVAPESTTTYYARREGCNTTADATAVVNVKSFVYAANGTSTNTYCTDNAGWNHFYTGNDIIFSVQGNLSGAPAGFPVATIYDNSTYYQQTQGSAAPSDCASNLNPNEERFEMDRSWNLNFGGGTQTGTYSVRFYYQPTERTTIETAANNHIAAYPSCGYSYKYANPNGFYWFKNVGANYTAPLYDGIHFTATTGTTNNGINYSEWAGVTNFSGGSGAVILIPITGLGVELTKFNALCLESEKQIVVSWETASEIKTSHFYVEQSTNGIDWYNLGQVQAAGNSATIKKYEFIQNDPRNINTSYFRLIQYDTDGQYKVYGPAIASCEEIEAFEAYPNPTRDAVTILIKANLNESEAYVSLTDINGKVIKSVSYLELKNNQFLIDLSSIEKGIYIIRLFDGITNLKMIKLVKK